MMIIPCRKCGKKLKRFPSSIRKGPEAGYCRYCYLTNRAKGPANPTWKGGEERRKKRVKERLLEKRKLREVKQITIPRIRVDRIHPSESCKSHYEVREIC